MALNFSKIILEEKIEHPAELQTTDLHILETFGERKTL